MTDPFVEISGQLNSGKKVVLARIIRQTGSAPRSVGTRCLVLEDGTLMGQCSATNPNSVCAENAFGNGTSYKSAYSVCP